VTALVDRQSNVIPEKHMHIFQGHYPLEVRLSETLREFPRFANNHPLLFELLGTKRLFAHMPPTARYVLPRCSLAAVPPHQDISYNRHMDDFCVVWVPLVPIDERCGGMAAYRRTNHVGEVLTGEVLPGANGWLRPIKSADLERAERVVLTPLEVGDAVILGHRTIHESMPNRSNRVRLSCDFRFFGERSHSTKHYLDLASDTVVAPATSGG
jgi:ectoine hydroxylase-related dioxygenase (phytanoyl-CoA dioxygenase family)